MTLPEAFAKALEHHQAGRFDDAEKLYRQILEGDSQNADVWHLFGVVSHQLGRHAAAIEAISRAIALKGSDFGFHHNLGEAYRAMGMNAEALASYRRAVELNPKSVESQAAVKALTPQQWVVAPASQPTTAQAMGHAAAALFGGSSPAISPDIWGEVFKDPAPAPKPPAPPASSKKPSPPAPLIARPAVPAPGLNSVDALNREGLAHAAEQRFADALECYGRALAIDPKVAKVHYNAALAHHLQGQRDEAVVCYRRAIDCKPDLFEAHSNLGSILLDMGRLEEAMISFRRAIDARPSEPSPWSNLGTCHNLSGQLDEAVECFQKAFELKPDDVNILLSLGLTLHEQKKGDDAIEVLQQALTLKPAPVIHTAMGMVHYANGRLKTAADCFRAALAIEPNDVDALMNLGTTLRDLGQRDEAIANYRQAVEKNPESAAAHNAMGVALLGEDKPAEAVVSFRQAVTLNPDFADAHYNLGNVLRNQGDIDDAIDSYRRALELNPESPATIGNLVHELQHTCEWRDIGDLSRRMVDIVERSDAVANPFTPFAFITLPNVTTAAQQLKCARQWAGAVLRPPTDKVAVSPPASRGRKATLTIGYLSNDFCSHATALLMVELIEKHDRKRFNIIAYSYGPDDGSPMRKRLVKAFDRFVEVGGLSFADAARRIADDGVDILVDLKGYMADARSQILTHRPAPIQVNYLGYPGTMGASFVDYILVDDFIAPPDQQPNFSERLVHLPGCYQVNDSQRRISPTPRTRRDCGLPEKGFVFCSFNNTYKITPEIFGAWMRLLYAVPGSVLWLVEANRLAPANLRREAKARGIDPARLIFAPRKAPEDHLARHRLADLFLDTFPVNAHTTASDALWVGVPMITIAGPTFISRVAGSLLRTLGLSDLIATSLPQYETLALKLAADDKRLAEVRARLQAARDQSPLFRAADFARGVEAAYVKMWKDKGGV